MPPTLDLAKLGLEPIPDELINVPKPPAVPVIADTAEAARILADDTTPRLARVAHDGIKPDVASILADSK